MAACGGADPNAPDRTPLAEKWFARATAAYRTGDIDDAKAAVDSALTASSHDTETRVLASRIALAQLDFKTALKVTEGIDVPDVHAIRGRAHWYAGDIEAAADELDIALKDPAHTDPWAREVSKLARRGHGRHPFAMEGGLVAAVEMPTAGAAMVVPCELEGEHILALVSTAMGELMIDSSTRKEPAWVNLRFGEDLEVKDVPALTHDLSPLTRQFGAPIKALIGIHALRRMHVTFDRRGSQFIVRRNEPHAPPAASRVPVMYVRGGGMMLRAQISLKDERPALFFVDSAAPYPLALHDTALVRAGANMAGFHNEPGAPAGWKVGSLPYFRLGALDLPQLPVVKGADVDALRKTMGVDVDAILGGGLLQAFRVTFAEDGRYLWLEPDPLLMQPQGAPPPGDDRGAGLPEVPAPLPEVGSPAAPSPPEGKGDGKGDGKPAAGKPSAAPKAPAKEGDAKKPAGAKP